MEEQHLDRKISVDALGFEVWELGLKEMRETKDRIPNKKTQKNFCE